MRTHYLPGVIFMLFIDPLLEFYIFQVAFNPAVPVAYSKQFNALIKKINFEY